MFTLLVRLQLALNNPILHATAQMRYTHLLLSRPWVEANRIAPLPEAAPVPLPLPLPISQCLAAHLANDMHANDPLAQYLFLLSMYSIAFRTTRFVRVFLRFLHTPCYHRDIAFALYSRERHLASNFSQFWSTRSLSVGISSAITTRRCDAPTSFPPLRISRLRQR